MGTYIDIHGNINHPTWIKKLTKTGRKKLSKKIKKTLSFASDFCGNWGNWVANGWTISARKSFPFWSWEGTSAIRPEATAGPQIPCYRGIIAFSQP